MASRVSGTSFAQQRPQDDELPTEGRPRTNAMRVHFFKSKIMWGRMFFQFKKNSPGQLFTSPPGVPGWHTRRPESGSPVTGALGSPPGLFCYPAKMWWFRLVLGLWSFLLWSFRTSVIVLQWWLNWLVWSGWIVMFQHARPADIVYESFANIYLFLNGKALVSSRN